MSTKLVDSILEFSPPDGPSPDDALWEVWRQDDNGNQFLVSGGHTREQAEELCASFEARGHKQLYWARQARRA